MVDIVEALIGAAKDRRDRPVHGASEHPVDDVFDWAGSPPYLRYQRATLLALREGETAVAAVLAQLAEAAALDAVAFEVFWAEGER
jgi:hypothetical protein